MLFAIPDMKKLAQHPACREFVVDYCQYGAKWRKRTRELSWFSADDSRLHKQCTGRAGICSATGKPHIVLSGSDPISHRLWTSIAEPYPRRFAKLFAENLKNAASKMGLLRLFEVGSGHATSCQMCA